MSDDATPYNSLTDNACSATVLPIEAALAHRICLAVAQVLMVGHGEVTILIAEHQVKFLQTMISDRLTI